MSTNNSNQSGNITLILMVVIGLIAGMYVYNRIENERIQAAEKAQEDAMIQQLMLRYKLLTGKETTYEETRKFYRDMKSMGYR